MIKEQLTKGITYIQTDNAHIMRVDPRYMFILGSILMPSPPHNSQELSAASIRQILSNIEEGQYDIKARLAKEYNLKPQWISNGTFFGPNSNVRPHKPLPEKPRYSRILGPVVQNMQGYEGIDHKRVIDIPEYLFQKNPDKNKANRWMFMQRIFEDTRIATLFMQRHGSWKSKDLAEKWDWVIGGAGALVENSVPITDLKYWPKPEGGNFVATDQSYSSGPIIAKSNSGIIYLIMNTNYPGNYKCTSPNSFSWKHAAEWLTVDFMSDIGYDDGAIQNAIAFDGSSARQLWIKKHIPIFHLDDDGKPVESIRAVPHFICLWG